MSALRSDVVALYVDPRGPYPSLVSEWCDEARDARTYAGSLPVVAHPPCGPWGRLHHLCTKQPRWAGPHAVGVVRRVGGVLEHPADSKLWAECELPRPGELPDGFGGVSVAVNQVDWGHGCVKPTWLYIVRATIRPSFPKSGGKPTQRITNGPRGASADHSLKRATAFEAKATPLAFAKWLLDIAASACGASVEVHP